MSSVDDAAARKIGRKRVYNTTRRRKERPPVKPQKMLDIAVISNGSCFRARKRVAENDPATCCQNRCNLRFNFEELERLRDQVPCLGVRAQRLRKEFVQACVTDNGTLRLVDSVGTGFIVCHAFFVAVTGCSKSLISSSLKLGDPGMKKRVTTKANPIPQVVANFILKLASRWEKQPGTGQIRMSFPTKKSVYRLFLASPAYGALITPGACKYAYFCSTWSAHCPHVVLKKVER